MSVFSHIGRLYCNSVLLSVLQNATQNSLELIDDPKAAAVDEIAAKLGLCKVGLFEVVLVTYSVADKSSVAWVLVFGVQVGWIFTDLLSEDMRIGTVRYSRNKVRMRLSGDLLVNTLATVSFATLRILTT